MNYDKIIDRMFFKDDIYNLSTITRYNLKKKNTFLPIETKIQLDKPSSEILSTEKINITGWVMSECKNKKVENYKIDNFNTGMTIVSIKRIC